MNKSNEKGISSVTLILCTIGAILVIILIWSTIRNNSKEAKTNSDAQNLKEKFSQSLEDGSKLNTSEQLMKTKKLDGLEITNIQLKEMGGITTLLADVTNTTKSNISEKIIFIDILDEAGNKITTARGVLTNMAPGMKIQLNVSVTADVANAYDFKISST